MNLFSKFRNKPQPLYSLTAFEIITNQSNSAIEKMQLEGPDLQIAGLLCDVITLPAQSDDVIE